MISNKMASPEYQLRRARQHLQAGNPDRALGKINSLIKKRPVDTYVVQAVHLYGICLRVYGQPREALTALQEADRLIDEIDDDLVLEAKILRDLGAALNTVAMLEKAKTHEEIEAREEQLDDAENSFWLSAKLLKDEIARIKRLPQSTRDLLLPNSITSLEAEVAATNGFWGFLMFERGAEIERGYSMLKQADEELVRLGADYEIYLVNNLVRLMRASNLSDRFALYDDRVHDLTSKSSKSPASRKRALVAIFGNRAYRWAEKRIG